MTRLLTGPDAGDLLGVALHPGRLLSWRARQVDHQPGRGCTAAYEVRVRWPDGRDTHERMAACTGRVPAGVTVLDDGAERVGVWRYPYDPDLPALATAADGTAVAALLDGFGLGGGPVRLALRAYRPRRRAVIEAVGERGRLFLKVVPPGRVRRLHERHRTLVAAGVPAAPSLGHTPDGLLVLQALPGRTLRQALRHGFPVLPPASAVLALLDRLPAELASGRRRRTWAEKAPHYAAVVGAALPPAGERAAALAAAIGAEGGRGAVVPVHGDLYEAQLLVAGDRVTGLLDIDTAGAGERLDDLACVLGHLSVLADLYRPQATAINRLGARYLGAFERSVDPADLRYRTAAVVLSLATGPHRVQEPGWPAATQRRLDLAERWVASARTMKGSSSRRHARLTAPAQAETHTQKEE
ncbi:phosphotransferase [Phytohabitans sp. ZYX-F-186]|uniref:Phosphotransferase n=1 Tax=Phytohabitans maris TaxID=3071409 RepID=A0ABU0ZBM5_9ACTN|nr:phosphotransferase [Phytohabitans sp. ZYX-F-186]MDQ7904452.1 phosphotransferase [Phytohabitans sp. ZYX-F-186]